jgi:hypothetical protein
MASLEAQCQSTAAIVNQCVLDDLHWRAFGYRGRPRRGWLFDVFLSRERLCQESVLLKELWGAAFGRVFYWATKREAFHHRMLFIARLMELCVEGLSHPLWPALRFSSANDAVKFLAEACRDYGRTNASRHSEVFETRCSSSLKYPMPNMWIAGVACIFAHPNSGIQAIIPALDGSGVADNLNSDLNIGDFSYLKKAEDLFRDHTR